MPVKRQHGAFKFATRIFSDNNVIGSYRFCFNKVLSGIPCSTKFLREFNFADGRFSAFCGNLFLRMGKTGLSCGELL